MKKKVTPLLQYLFLLFSISGVCATGYLIYEVINPRNNWLVEVTGNINSEQRRDIEETILYFVRLNKDRINENTLTEILKLNPWVREVTDVTISSRKKIKIELKFKKIAYIYHDPQNHQFHKFSLKGETLETSTNNFHEIDKKIPVLCLTDGSLSDVNLVYSLGSGLYSKMRRDIISTFEKTGHTYGFVWQYISEICLGTGSYRYTIYPSHARSRIQTNDKFDMSLIRRLWAIFYYLEKKLKVQSTEIKFNQYNARVKINPFF